MFPQEADDAGHGRAAEADCPLAPQRDQGLRRVDAVGELHASLTDLIDLVVRSQF